jgi:hypothetical protein
MVTFLVFCVKIDLIKNIFIEQSSWNTDFFDFLIFLLNKINKNSISHFDWLEEKSIFLPYEKAEYFWGEKKEWPAANILFHYHFDLE